MKKALLILALMSLPTSAQAQTKCSDLVPWFTFFDDYLQDSRVVDALESNVHVVAASYSSGDVVKGVCFSLYELVTKWVPTQPWQNSMSVWGIFWDSTYYNTISDFTDDDFALMYVRNAAFLFYADRSGWIPYGDILYDISDPVLDELVAMNFASTHGTNKAFTLQSAVPLEVYDRFHTQSQTATGAQDLVVEVAEFIQDENYLHVSGACPNIKPECDPADPAWRGYCGWDCHCGTDHPYGFPTNECVFEEKFGGSQFSSNQYAAIFYNYGVANTGAVGGWGFHYGVDLTNHLGFVIPDGNHVYALGKGFGRDSSYDASTVPMSTVFIGEAEADDAESEPTLCEKRVAMYQSVHEQWYENIQTSTPLADDLFKAYCDTSPQHPNEGDYLESINEDLGYECPNDVVFDSQTFSDYMDDLTSEFPAGCP